MAVLASGGSWFIAWHYLPPLAVTTKIKTKGPLRSFISFGIEPLLSIDLHLEPPPGARFPVTLALDSLPPTTFRSLVCDDGGLGSHCRADTTDREDVRLVDSGGDGDGDSEDFNEVEAGSGDADADAFTSPPSPPNASRR